MHLDGDDLKIEQALQSCFPGHAMYLPSPFMAGT
jgi:hypothetical protein